MTFGELAEKVAVLTESERLELIAIITDSLKQNSSNSNWKFLEPREESWRKQLYMKGRKLPASSVWYSMLVNNMTPEESADDWDLHIEAVYEAIRYCVIHRELLKQEAEIDRNACIRHGITPAKSSVAD